MDSKQAHTQSGSFVINAKDREDFRRLNDSLLNRQLELEKECHRSETPQEFIRCTNRYSLLNEAILNKLEASFLYNMNAYRNCIEARTDESFCNSEYVQSVRDVYQHMLREY